MLALLGSVWAASLLGSPHCAGMCGGFVCFYAGQPGSRRNLWLAHAAYNTGRLLSYVALGALAGALGERLERIGVAVGLSHLAAVTAGALMILWGAGHLAATLGVRVPGAHGPAFLRRTLSAAMRTTGSWPPERRALLLGLLTTLLPCGWLYAFAATAAGTGRPLIGALVMAAFWAGTLPVMAGLGVAAQSAFGPLRRRLPTLTAAGLIVVGLLTVAGKLGPGPHRGGAATRCAACAEGVHVRH